MKSVDRNFKFSKLGESVYNALTMKTQVDEDDKRILQYSYNFASDTEQKPRHSLSTGEVSFGELTRNPVARAERISEALNKEMTLRRNSFSFSGGHKMAGNETEKGVEPPKAKNALLYGAASQGFVEKFSADFATETITMENTVTENPITENNGLRGPRTRKLGLGDKANRGLMSHKLRKKAVCDSSDNFHYQRQFLRVLNKRF